MLQIAFLALVLVFHRTAFKYDWNPKLDLYGNIIIIGSMLLVNIIMNYFVHLKIMTAFFLGGVHFSLCLKIFSFGHVLYEVHKLIRSTKDGTFNKLYANEDINIEVN